jgi:Ca2+-binding RTX toxin-like protein
VRKFLCFVFLSGAAALLSANSAWAESCTYTASSKTVTAAITPGHEATLKVTSDGAINFGAVPAPCDGATATNTDTINVTGGTASDERLVVDLGEHALAPGATAEFNTPEIEVAATLGDATDTVVLQGTAGDDTFAAGVNGLSITGDGDADVSLSPANMRLEVASLGGVDFVNGRGGLGSGAAYLGAMVIDGGEGNDSLLRGSAGDDRINGGPGNDVLDGQDGGDNLDGGPGDDSMTGGAGNDSIVGGSGRDALNGSAGADVLDAADGEADTQINGGPDIDTAYYDLGIDVNPTAVEIKIVPCAYDPATKSITASVPTGRTSTLKVTSSGQIMFGGASLLPCGTATATNTDTIRINGTTGASERLILDLGEHELGPGATPEFNLPEIELDVALGDESDTFVLYGTAGDDFFSPGQNGMALNSDGDVDVTFTPSSFNMEVYGLGGSDFINGRGTGGAGLHFLGPLVVDGGEGDDSLVRGSSNNDRVIGGPGNDVLDAQNGNDFADGGPGNDTVAGGGENDTVIGGPGIDELIGSEGDDVLDAADGEADTNISGGAGDDTAYYDLGLDANPIAVEHPIAGGGGPPPPPPSPAPCAYDGTTKTLVATMPAGGTATLKVDAGAITFANPTPVDCGGATTANTESITVVGAAGTVETLTIDQSGGAFAPGVTPETGTGALSEIELLANLGDATDSVLVIGTAGDDSIFVGTNGIALDADTDVDLTFDVMPATFELRGDGGKNAISGKGGAGSGTPFPGPLTLVAGDGGDTVTGGLGDDMITGGGGADTLEGREGNDTVSGGGGNDTVSGNVGNDSLTGGAGADTIIGSDGDDLIHAEDGEAETTISGGAGTDTAYYDAAFDPLPAAVENKIPV